MSKHESPQPKQPMEVEESRRKKKASQPFYDQLKMTGEGVTGIAVTQSLDEHSAMLAEASSDEQRTDMVMQLQETYGNSYAQRVIEHMQSRRKSSLSSDRKTGMEPVLIRADSPRLVVFKDGFGISLDLRATLDGEGTAPTEEEVPRTLRLEPEELLLGIGPHREDAILPGAVSVQQETARGAEVPADCFGICNRYVSRIISATPHPRWLGLLGTNYEVSAAADIRYRWDVQNLGCTDVASATGPAATADTWSQIVHDLTPSSGPVPRSPRVEHWCQDLTERHEQYHARDWTTAFAVFAPLAIAWLMRQTASSVDDAINKGDLAIDQLITFVNTYFGSGDSAPCEVRAYTDGVPLYRARAQAVEARATEEGWEPGIIIE